MQIEELKIIGERLANDLERLAEMYHIKSDQHVILSYEASGVRSMASSLGQGSECKYDLLESNLLSEWGNILASEQPEIFDRVRRFRQQYEQVRLRFIAF